MKTVLKIATGLLIVLIAACSYQNMADMLTPKKESQFAKDYLHQLQSRNFDYVKKYIDPSIKEKVTNDLLGQVANYFPTGKLLSTKLIGSQVNKFNDQWEGNFSFEYHFSGGWAVANVALKEKNHSLSVIGFHVYKTNGSLRKINKFSLVGKSALQYVIFALAIAVPLFVIVTLYFCVRTPMPKRKWLWVLFVLVGFVSITVNWTTGQTAIQLLTIKLFSASAMAASPFSPWFISVSIPVGAILFWFKRKGFIKASDATDTINAGS